MHTESHIILPDGRRLAYAEFGKPGGSPVLYFHGAPASRLEPLLVGDEAWARLGLRVIAPDRPGVGGSAFLPDRGFSDWPRDVTALADALGLGRFAVLGNSGGGPYAAACAAKIPDRLSAAVIVSGGWQMNLPEAKRNMAVVNRLFFVLAGRASPLLRLLLKVMGNSSVGDREKELAKLRARVPPADYAAFAEPGRFEALHAMMRECMRQGTKGPAWDIRLYTRPFDFKLDDIRMPLKLFHGERDVNVPIALVRRMVAGLPDARLITYKDEAHFSTLCNHLDEFAQALVSR
jgi:pimeloyl-ACP methyl ester carboxylesterase